MKKIMLFFSFCSLLSLAFFAGCNRSGDDFNISNIKNNINSDNGLLADVNGDYIYKYEIDEVYKLYNNTVSYNKILQDSIFEQIVLQQSASFGISISKNEIDEILEQYRINQPDYYKQSIELYGEERLRNKLKNTTLYNKTRDYICENIISDKNTISDKEYTDFISAYGLSDYLDQYEKDFITANLWEELEEYLFRSWVHQSKSQSELIVFGAIHKDNIIINDIKNVPSNRIDAEIKQTSVDNWNFAFLSNIEIPLNLIPTHYFEVYIQPHNTKKEERNVTPYSILNHYSIVYEGKSDESMVLNFSENEIPLRDYGNVGMKYSFINNTELLISKCKELYIMQTTTDNINFDIEFKNISEQDMLFVLNSIL